MTQAEAPEDTRPWRKRRPVLSRVVLYALGAALIALLVVLWSNRSDVDEQDRIEALRQQLRGMPAVLLSMDGGENQLLETLEQDDFTDEDLPDDVKSLIERTRALALRKKFRMALAEDPTQIVPLQKAIETAQQRASRLAPAEEVQALRLEWAEGLLETGQADKMGPLLDDPDVEWTKQPARILRAYLQAGVLQEQGDTAEAIQKIESHLAALRAPLPMDDEYEIGGKAWSSARAALVLTEKLSGLRAGQNDPRIWQRLLRLSPGMALAVVRAAAGLASMGQEKMALSAWQQALDLNRDEAEALMAGDPAMRDLKKLLGK